jgi:Holliday junction resolvase RusA-like endonuclease
MSFKDRVDAEYNRQFGMIPETQIDRIAYMLGKKINNEKFNKDVTSTANKIKRIKIETVHFTLNTIVKPSARPRANSRGGYIHMYVPRAKENGEYFKEFAKENNLPFINTPCTLDIIVYEKTPTSFSIKNKVLAELGIIRPWKRTGDFDNYAKTIGDCIQHGMLEDDALIVDASQSLRYSILPRCEVTLKYMVKHPDEILFPNKKG